jgi:hypothetical protein
VRNEEEIIERTIQEYSTQTLRRDQFEVLLVLNGPLKYVQDESHSLIVKSILQEKYNIDCHVVSFECPFPFHGGGFSRRIGADISLMRSERRQKQELPFYIICDDADCQNLQRNMIEKIVAAFDENPGIDIVRRMAYRDPDYLAQHDLLHLHHALRMLTECGFLPRIARTEKSRFIPYSNPKPTDGQFWLGNPTSGCNTAFSAEVIALLRGGFEPVMQRSDLPQRIKVEMLRGLPLNDSLSLSNATLMRIPVRSSQSTRRDAFRLAERLKNDDFTSSNYHNFTDEQTAYTVRNTEALQEHLDLSEFEAWSDIRSIRNDKLTAIVNEFLRYYTERFFPYVFPTMDNTILAKYANFLSVYIGGSCLSANDQVFIVNPEAHGVKLNNPFQIKNQLILYREQFNKKNFRFQKRSDF